MSEKDVDDEVRGMLQKSRRTRPQPARAVRGGMTKLRLKRLSRGMTQGQLGEATGVTGNFISALETGTALARLASFLGVADPLDLLREVKQDTGK